MTPKINHYKALLLSKNDQIGHSKIDHFLIFKTDYLMRIAKIWNHWTRANAIYEKMTKKCVSRHQKSHPSKGWPRKWDFVLNLGIFRVIISGLRCFCSNLQVVVGLRDCSRLERQSKSSMLWLQDSVLKNNVRYWIVPS